MTSSLVPRPLPREPGNEASERRTNVVGATGGGKAPRCPQNEGQ